jgi:hypothetical protein
MKKMSTWRGTLLPGRKLAQGNMPQNSGKWTRPSSDTRLAVKAGCCCYFRMNERIMSRARFTNEK